MPDNAQNKHRGRILPTTFLKEYPIPQDNPSVLVLMLYHAPSFPFTFVTSDAFNCTGCG